MASRTAGSLSAAPARADTTATDTTAADTTAADTSATGSAATKTVQAGTAARPAAWVRGLTREFAGRRVLDELDLDIAPGEFVALIGRSGSGKSTLLRALAGLDRGGTGDLGVEGTAAVAFQEPRLLPWRRVLANVGLGLRAPDPAAAARRALEEVGLTERADAWPLTLSGGEAQRAALARALVREPGLLLLDEPFSALDALTRIAMHRLVLRLWESHRPAVLLVTHDVDEALVLADRVLVLASGRITFSGPVEVPRPRDRDNPGLTALRHRLLTELGVTTEGQ
jgi:sulfonate transport system ATP-binding protein